MYIMGVLDDVNDLMKIDTCIAAQNVYNGNPFKNTIMCQKLSGRFRPGSGVGITKPISPVP